MFKEEFIIHRNNLANLMADNSAMILFSRYSGEGREINRNFYYASGLNEFGDKLVITKFCGKVNVVLFIEPYDEYKAKWVGRGLFKEEATELSGIKDVRYLNSFDSYVSMLCGGCAENIYIDFRRESINTTLSDDEAFAKQITDKYPYVKVLNAHPLFASARTIKSDVEVNKIKEAIHITRCGLEAIMTNLKPGIYEYQVESYFDQAIKYNGATGYAFNTIAASGENGCCLHYSKNNSQIKDGDLILFDLGASKDNYCSDISRTFPANGKFTERQKLIYNIVLGGQELMFKTMKPGLTTRDCNQVLIKYFATELKKISLIKEDSEVSKYYFHGVSHHMGMDCHDLCDYGPLKPGCVISNEPGLYIAEEGIGIRIEDDVLITEDGCVNLSSEIIKSVEDIEKFMAEVKKNEKK